MLKRGIYLALLMLLTACSNSASEEKDPKVNADQNINKETNEINQPSAEATVPGKDDFDLIEGDADVLSNMKASISYNQDKTISNFNFEIKNDSKHPFTFHFKTTQQYSYSINTKDGKLIKEQDNSTIMKLPSTYFIKPGGTISYPVTIENLSPGSYKINFVFLATELPLKKSYDFIVE